MTLETRDTAKDFRTIFGSEIRMDIWGRVAQLNLEPPEPFTGDDIKKELEQTHQLSPQSTSNEINKLEGLGMIERVESPSYDRRVHYRRLPSDYWRIVEAAIEVTARAAV